MFHGPVPPAKQRRLYRGGSRLHRCPLDELQSRGAVRPTSPNYGPEGWLFAATSGWDEAVVIAHRGAGECASERQGEDALLGQWCIGE